MSTLLRGGYVNAEILKPEAQSANSEINSNDRSMKVLNRN